jgi:hypothetical protein
MKKPVEKRKRPAKKANPELYQVGDTVDVSGEEGIVKEPNAPRGLLGIAINGKYSLVEPEDVKLVTETMNRLRQLSEKGTYAPPEERMRRELHWLKPDEYKEHCQSAYEMGYRHGQNLRSQNKELRGVKCPYTSFAGEYYYGVGLGDGHDGGPKRPTLPLFENISQHTPKPNSFIVTLEGKLTADQTSKDTLTEQQAMDIGHDLSKQKDGDFVVSDHRGKVIGSWNKGTFTVAS